MTMESISKLELECATLWEENLRLKSEIQSLRQDNFMDDPKSLLFHWIAAIHGNT